MANRIVAPRHQMLLVRAVAYLAKHLAKIDPSVSKVRRYLKPGPIVPVSSAWAANATS